MSSGAEADNATGTLSIRLLLSGAADGAAVQCKIAHPDQGVLFDGGLELTPEGGHLRGQPFCFEHVLPWDHGHPELYTVTLTLAAPDGTVCEVVPYQIGFRRLELKNGLMLLNGKRLMLNGVNRHEWNPDTGRAIGMADFFRANDPSRVVHYEGTFNCPGFDDISDVESRMYASPEAVRAYLESDPKKPFILCEYMHNMGNSLGGMESYIRLGEEFPMYQGGFIWDYMDQALWHVNCNGERVLGYGGDFGERQTDYAFSANGIVFADGSEKPAMQEVWYWYSSPEERARHDAANERAKRALALRALKGKKGPLRIVHGDGALGVRGVGFEVLFSYAEGGPVSLVSGGREWLWRAPRPAYWRAPTENDLGCGFAANSSLWEAVDGWQVCEKWEILADSPDAVSIRYTYTAPALPGLKTDVIYTVDSTGRMAVTAQYYGAAGRPGLPLFGLRFETPEPLEYVEWLGLSGETYPDRKKGGVFGWHREVPHIPGYLVPQECGCHTDARAAILHGRGGGKLALELDGAPFAFSAIPYTPRQLEQAAHREELPQGVRTVVSVCGAMRGVGGIDSWGADVEEAYRISGEQNQQVSFSIRLVEN